MGRRLREFVLSGSSEAREVRFVSDARSARFVGRAALAAAARTWARELDARAVPAGARVLIDVDDPLAFAVVHLAVMAAGRCSAPVDPSAPPAEATRVRDALRPALVVTDRAVRAGILVAPGTGLPEEPSDGPRGGWGNGPEPGAGSVVLLTSGSTGEPKAVELGEAQLLHVAGAVARHHRLTASDRGYNALPLFHINAQVVALLATLVAGGELVLDRRFHRTGFWPLLVEQDVTWINAVPSILTILSRDAETEDHSPVVPPGLRFLRSASAPLPLVVRELITARTGVPVVESYGMTEAASQITATPLDGPVRPGSVGRPVDVELQVVDADGDPCPPDVVGRVLIRGAGVISGYAGGRAADRFDADGWLDTSDLGRLDADGFLYLVGRADDVVNRGGELVYPREVEEVLLGDGDVVEAVVLGRPDDVLGEVPVALVRTAAADTAALVERLEARCAERLARFKRPAEIRVIDAFPLGPTGKVRRTVLRDQLAGV
jgi:acyl-CoA synthetase (AMP-forming)/AMP-acid ligase II